MNIQQIVQQRKNTEAASRLLKDQLAGFLSTLAPLLSPERVFAHHAGGRPDKTGDADINVDQLRKKYLALRGPPLELPSDLDPYWLSLVGNRLELEPFEYAYELDAAHGKRKVRITSPVKWLLVYPSGCTAAELEAMATGKATRKIEEMRQFTVNALVLDMVVAAHRGVAKVFDGLRYTLRTGPMSGTVNLPLATIASCVPSARPPDDLLGMATEFSGVPAFIELIDPAVLDGLKDPLREELAKALR